MNFSPESVNHRFITYSDSEAGKNRGWQKLQISTNERYEIGDAIVLGG